MNGAAGRSDSRGYASCECAEAMPAMDGPSNSSRHIRWVRIILINARARMYLMVCHSSSDGILKVKRWIASAHKPGGHYAR